MLHSSIFITAIIYWNHNKLESVYTYTQWIHTIYEESRDNFIGTILTQQSLESRSELSYTWKHCVESLKQFVLRIALSVRVVEVLYTASSSVYETGKGLWINLQVSICKKKVHEIVIEDYPLSEKKNNLP